MIGASGSGYLAGTKKKKLASATARARAAAHAPRDRGARGSRGGKLDVRPFVSDQEMATIARLVDAASPGETDEITIDAARRAVSMALEATAAADARDADGAAFVRDMQVERTGDLPDVSGAAKFFAALCNFAAGRSRRTCHAMRLRIPASRCCGKTCCCANARAPSTGHALHVYAHVVLADSDGADRRAVPRPAPARRARWLDGLEISTVGDRAVQKILLSTRPSIGWDATERSVCGTVEPDGSAVSFRPSVACGGGDGGTGRGLGTESFEPPLPPSSARIWPVSVGDVVTELESLGSDPKNYIARAFAESGDCCICRKRASAGRERPYDKSWYCGVCASAVSAAAGSVENDRVRWRRL